MSPPIISTITLVAETIIGFFIGYIIISGYRKGKIPFGLAYFAIIYELVFNISYMVYRFFWAEPSSLSKGLVILAIFHGILALIVFIFEIVFLAIAIRRYKKGLNFFKKNKFVTFGFAIVWTIALISGIVIYFIAYF